MIRLVFYLSARASWLKGFKISEKQRTINWGCKVRCPSNQDRTVKPTFCLASFLVHWPGLTQRWFEQLLRGQYLCRIINNRLPRILDKYFDLSIKTVWYEGKIRKGSERTTCPEGVILVGETQIKVDKCSSEWILQTVGISQEWKVSASSHVGNVPSAEIVHCYIAYIVCARI